MRTFKFITVIATVIFAFTGCGKGKFLSSIDGSAYEILVVADKDMWKQPCGQALFNTLSQDMPSMPQKEPMLSVSRCSPNEFTSMLKPTRNIVIVDVNAKKYKRNHIIYSVDKWAHTQSVATLAAPNRDSLTALIESRGNELVHYFIQAELNREKTYLNKQSNAQLEQMVYEQFGIQIKVPVEITQYKKDSSVNALWLSSGTTEVRTDMIIYAYPYKDKQQLSIENLMAKRDSVCRKLIPGPNEGSYMGTETKYDYPILTKINKNGKFCAQITGLWRVYGGSMMGGPYISHTCIDQLHQQTVTVEGSIYAPQKKKRTYIRKMEAVLQTEQLPNFADDIVVTSEK